MWRLRRRLRELEARVAALETTRTVSYDMPDRPTIDSEPVDPQALWRALVGEYRTAAPDAEDELPGVYL